MAYSTFQKHDQADTLRAADDMRYFALSDLRDLLNDAALSASRSG